MVVLFTIRTINLGHTTFMIVKRRERYLTVGRIGANMLLLEYTCVNKKMQESNKLVASKMQKNKNKFILLVLEIFVYEFN